MSERQAGKREVASELDRLAVEPDPRPSEGWTYRGTMYQECDGIDYPSDLGMSSRELRTLLEAHAPGALAS